MLKRHSALFLLLLAACHAPTQPSSPAPTNTTVTQFEEFELHDLGASSNDAVAHFRTPSGQEVSIGAFRDGEELRIRYAPMEAGKHSFEVVDETTGTTLRSGTLAVEPSDEPGFVRLDERGGFPGLRRDDGTPFFILGENRINVYDPTWNYRNMSAPDYVAYMADNGMTTLRVFVFSDCEHEESDSKVQPGCLEPRLGEFDPKVARQFDEIFDAAEKEGIYVVLTVFAIGFSPDDTWKSWEDNPYSTAGGSPRDRFEFFDEADVREQAKKRLEYVVDRWGHSTSLLAIDLLNEPEWDGEIGEDAWTPWAEEMAAYVEEIDPYDHLVTVGSVGLHWNVEGDEHRWWASEHSDLTQWHLYGPEVYDVHALAETMSLKVDETRHHDKPIFCGEFAYGGEDKETYDHTHVGLWSATFSGAGALAHSAPPFNVDSDEPMTPERGRHFKVLREFLEPVISRAPLTPVRDVDTGDSGVRAWSLANDTVRAIWLMAPKENYGAAVEGGTATVPLGAGRHTVTWFDDVTGEQLSSEVVGSDGGDVQLVVPSFTRHIAARIVSSET